MNFIVPQMFWSLAVIVPLMVFFFWWAWRKRQQLITQFISSRLLGHLKVGVSPNRQKARMALMIAAVIFLILALARPQWGVTNLEVRQRGVDIMVAIDTSNSMLAEDVSPNRLVRAKLAAMDLAKKARTDRLGLIAFSGAAVLQCPLTLDDAAFAQSVQALDTQTISEGGTSIEEAIDEAMKALKDEPENCKVLVLFTDGEDHDGDPIGMAQKAASEGLVIFTVGIGTKEGDKIPLRDERGRIDSLRDENNQPITTHLDEDLLQQIALATGKGFYLKLSGAKTTETLYDSGIAPLPKTEHEAKTFQNFHERYHWPLAIAMVILLLEMFLPDRKRGRSKKSIEASVAPLAETVAVLLLLISPCVAGASPSSALREYNSGKYEDSFNDYGKLLEGKKDDPRLKFNAGAAAYQSQKMEDAEKLFTDVLGSPDLGLQERAYYNRGNTKFRMGQSLPDQKKKQETWENAVKDYESALKLNQNDDDAKFNLDFVKQQLELLKQQQQQQQNQQNQKDDKKDQKQNQKQQNQQNQDDQQKDQKKQDKQDKNQQQDKDKPQPQKPEDQKSDDPKQPQPSQSSGDQNEQSKKDAEQEAAAMAEGKMTPQQAAQLLDSMKDEDKVFQPALSKRKNNQNRNRKNW